MKRFGSCCLALLFGFFTPALIWVGAGAALYQGVYQSKKTKIPGRTLPYTVCSVDNDCPPGFICVGGHCVPAR